MVNLRVEVIDDKDEVVCWLGTFEMRPGWKLDTGPVTMDYETYGRPAGTFAGRLRVLYEYEQDERRTYERGPYDLGARDA